jgi:enolase
MIIKEIRAKKIKNSRNEDSIEILVKFDKGKSKASAPSGKSKGKFEKKDYNYSINKTIEKINSFDKLNGLEINNFDDLKKVEKIFDFGANPMVALEYAILKNFKKLNFGYNHIAIPIGNSIGGGLHTKGRKKPDFQEFLIYVENCKEISKRIKINKLVYISLAKQLKKIDSNFKNNRNDEGAWICSLTNLEVLNILKNTIREISYKTGYKLRIGLDVASNSFFKNGHYNYKNYSPTKRSAKLSKDEQIDYLVHIVKKYKIGYLEDPLNENDFSGFAELRKRVNDCMIVGDDLTVTNLSRVKRAVREKSINSMIVKPNQIGSLIEVKKVVEFCKLNKIKIIFSHRSGETNEYFLADLSYIFGADFIKTGIYGKERIVKLNRLKRINKKFYK